MESAVAHGTEPRTPQNRTRMRSELITQSTWPQAFAFEGTTSVYLSNFQGGFDARARLPEPLVVLIPWQPCRDELCQDSRPFLFDRREVLQAHREMPRIGVDAAEHDLIAEHELLIDLIDGLIGGLRSARQAEEAQHAV